MTGKREIVSKINIIKISKLMVFFLITSLPFISITNIIGMEIFIDSFENSDSYILLENEKIMSATKIDKQSYIIIQKIDHPEFELDKNDQVMYCSFNGEILCNKINDIKCVGAIKKYEINNNEENDEIIYKNQIIGKIIKVVDENIWNSICLNFWSTSIDKLNINSLI